MFTPVLTRIDRYKLMPQDVSSHTLPLTRRGFLIETKMDTAKDSPVVHVVRNLFPTRIMKHDIWQCRVRKRNRVSILTE